MPGTDINQVSNATGQLLSSVEIVVTDEQLARREAPAQIRAALARLQEIAQQADGVAAQGTNVTQPQLKGLFSAVADLARIQRRLIIALGRD